MDQSSDENEDEESKRESLLHFHNQQKQARIARLEKLQTSPRDNMDNPYLTKPVEEVDVV